MSTAGRLPGPARFAQAVMMGVNVLVIVAVTIWDVWATWVAFFGGVLPVPFGRLVTGGSLLLGALFVFVVSPVIFGVARLVTAGLSALVVAAAAAPAFAVRAARDARADHSPAAVQPKSFDEAPTLFDDAPMLFDDAPTSHDAPERAAITVRYPDGHITFSRTGDKAQILAAGFHGAPPASVVENARVRARARLRAQGSVPWFSRQAAPARQIGPRDRGSGPGRPAR